ncbi:low molecular weight protein-tyrosine-phosphatase [Psychromicrobium lacuslunae]|uniref:protein-tyrosine-phosphatase n=1 Tax=Psychromicrobium lacuslunae TaxID=1618207 RepID=A0A0D4C035_9MICC|nr:low molecular weight protein-tyrosine-phosphatase [Psychromicrobium lacuslunae]AJT42017.1 hypothetical protein UM93_11760 [Psychromicrobium lacuslunae]
MSSRYRIVTVCTGNICRSPMAEVILRQAFQDSEVELDSAGTTDWERGSPIDPRAISVLEKHNVEIGSGHQARKFQPEDFVTSDLILALDTDHFDWLQRHAPSATNSEIRLLREFDPAADKADLGIADPWYGDLSDFEETYRLITAALPGVVEYVQTSAAGHA